MKTIEFRCEECNKLLAKITGKEFETTHTYDEPFSLSDDGLFHEHLEIQCPRCKHLNRKELYAYKFLNMEALEAHNRVLRHGDNV